MAEGAPARVAIIGGGCAAMAAAFELTRPELDQRFAVTVYQQGFRLGGKGASGRGASGRIEEHGLHVWLGYYENAFRLMRDCYAELARDPARCPIATWRDAFTPANHVAAADRMSDGRWDAWRASFPAHDGLPGDPTDHYQPLSVPDYLARALSLVAELLRTLEREGTDRKTEVTDRRPAPPRAPDAGAPYNALDTLLRYGTLAGLGAVLEALRLLELVLASMPVYRPNVLLRALDVITRAVQRELQQYVRDRDALRRVWSIADLVLATVRGSIRFHLATDPRGFDAIDEYDCREWLRLNGASEESINSPFVRALYDLAFAYEGGDMTRPRIAAGAAIRGSLRAFFTYKGAFFWKMEAGMGDVVFAPLYEVLKKRGVRFEFFHRLRDVEVGGEHASDKHVRALSFDVQAEVRGGGEYPPLIDVRGLPCWPAEPRYDQLVSGERYRAEGRHFESHWETGRVRERRLEVARDFDFVVLGVGVAALPHVAPELIARDARFKAMVEHVTTVPTRAVQLWLRQDMRSLGREHAPLSLSGFVEPFDTWADMTHVGRLESWPEAPPAIAYLCSVMPDPGAPASTDPAACKESVRAAAIEFLEQHIGHLWPGAVTADGGFRWELLLDAHRPAFVARDARAFDSQFWTANVSPSDRYTLALPGSTAFRISPLDRSYDNLTLACDWTACGLNLGCVESAVMSGMLAAHALAGVPKLSAIIGWDHP